MTSSSSQKLMRCPRCGGYGKYQQPRLSGYYDNDSSKPAYMYVAGCEHGCFASPEFETEDEAAEWWNRRPPKKPVRRRSSEKRAIPADTLAKLLEPDDSPRHFIPLLRGSGVDHLAPTEPMELSFAEVQLRKG